MPKKVRVLAPEYSYFGTVINRELARRVREHCVLKAKTLREVFEEALEDYLRKHETR